MRKGIILSGYWSLTQLEYPKTMTSTFRTSHISKQALVLMLLLSFLGQAFASASVCAMSMENSDLIVAESSEMNTSLPCHQQMIETETTMECCDEGSMTMDHSCSCPDGGCAGSISFISNVSSNSSFNHNAVSSFITPRFTSQIDSALFRPPIV